MSKRLNRSSSIWALEGILATFQELPQAAGE